MQSRAGPTLMRQCSLAWLLFGFGSLLITGVRFQHVAAIAIGVNSSGPVLFYLQFSILPAFYVLGKDMAGFQHQFKITMYANTTNGGSLIGKFSSVAVASGRYSYLSYTGGDNPNNECQLYGAPVGQAYVLWSFPLTVGPNYSNIALNVLISDE